MRIEGIFRVRLFRGLLVGELIAYFLVLAANGVVFYHFFNVREDESKVPVLIAGTLGHVICLNFAILLVLPQRNSIWIPILGVSVERMIKYHRIMGRWLFTVITAHLSAFWYHWITNGHIKSTPIPHASYALMPASILGHSAWFCVVVILITSLEFFRRTKFELFFYTHHLFLAVVGLAIYHTYLTQKFSEDMLLYWILPGIVMYTTDVIVRFWRSYQDTQIISIVRDAGSNILLVKLRRKGFKFTPGQYVYINFPQVSYFQWHPFSITSAPSESQTNATIITLAIRDMGPFTWSHRLHNLLEETLLPERIKVRLDGPYGKLSIAVANYPVLVLVGGGIGISPLISILSEYHNNPNLAFDKLYFMWCAKHQDYLAPFAHMLQDIETNDMLGKLEIHRYATRDLEAAVRPHYSESSQRGLSLNVNIHGRLTNTSPQQYTPGRPVLRDFFGRLVLRHPTSRIGVVVCGPTVMANDVEHICASFNKTHKNQIDLHRESFEI